MDIYQEKLLSRNKTLSLCSDKGDGKVELAEDELILTQNENYGIIEYLFCIENETIESVQFDDEVVSGNAKFEKNISFSNRYKKIVITFKNGFAEPCKLNIKYVEADTGLYDEKVALENKKQCLDNMNLACNKGIDLVNFCWGKASDNYSKTEICLYFSNCDHNMFMQRFIVDGDVFYKSITGLAFGRYKYEVSQFDEKGELIISTDGSFTLENIVDKCMTSLSGKFDEVKGQVRASGKNVVTFGR